MKSGTLIFPIITGPLYVVASTPKSGTSISPSTITPDKRSDSTVNSGISISASTRIVTFATVVTKKSGVLISIVRTEPTISSVSISKSGTTPETISQLNFFESVFRKYKLNCHDHIWLMSDPENFRKFQSQCRNASKETPYETLSIQLDNKSDIGGRFSAPATRIFLLPLALIGRSLKPILEKAKYLNTTRIKSEWDDMFVQLGIFLAEESWHGRDKVTFILPESLRAMGPWIEHLFEESLGKDGKGVGVFFGEDINTDILPPLEENDRVFVRFFLEQGIDEKKTIAKKIGEKGYPLIELSIPSRESFAGIMYGLEKSVATIGYMLDINFVDQPAVERYKKNTAKIIQENKGKDIKVEENLIDSSLKAIWKDITLYYNSLIKQGEISQEQILKQIKRMKGDSSNACLLYTSPSPRDLSTSRMPSSA